MGERERVTANCVAKWNNKELLIPEICAHVGSQWRFVLVTFSFGYFRGQTTRVHSVHKMFETMFTWELWMLLLILDPLESFLDSMFSSFISTFSHNIPHNASRNNCLCYYWCFSRRKKGLTYDSRHLTMVYISNTPEYVKKKQFKDSCAYYFI